MATHHAVVTILPGRPLAIMEMETPKPTGKQVRVLNQWTASTPLDLHQADGHLLVEPPQILGDGVAGTVVETGPDVEHLHLGDQVFGFTWRSQAEKAHQLYVVADENILAKIPDGVTMQEAAAVPNNFVTVWHTLTKDLDIQLPWPKSSGDVHTVHDDWILVWGGSSSVGMYTLQVLKYYGYTKVLTTASKQHHERMKRYGAQACFDYRDDNVVDQIHDYLSEADGRIASVLDCIGSLDGSVRPVSRITTNQDCRVAILLPVIVKDAAPGVAPEYALDVLSCADWGPKVKASGVRTHFYTDNPFLAEKLQPEIMPWALVNGVIEPNDQVIVEGGALIVRANKALSMLREKKVSGARLVWRVAEPWHIETAVGSLKTT